MAKNKRNTFRRRINVSKVHKQRLFTFAPRGADFIRTMMALEKAYRKQQAMTGA